MKVVFRKSFVRDAKKLKDVRVGAQVRAVIEAAESVSALTDIPSLKKLSGPSRYYRVRVGDYRIGLFVEGDELEFVRVLHRKDIYRHFP